jgi:hypothetical protein
MQQSLRRSDRHATIEKWFGLFSMLQPIPYYIRDQLLLGMDCPLFYSRWLDSQYRPVDRDEFRAHIQVRLPAFAEEEGAIQPVLFDQVLERLATIDH